MTEIHPLLDQREQTHGNFHQGATLFNELTLRIAHSATCAKYR